MVTQIVETVAEIVSPERVSAAWAERELRSRDQSDHPAHPADVIVWPETTAEVSAILRYANEQRIPVTAWGAGTSLEGNPIPIHGGILLDFGRMNQINAVYATDFQVAAQPGLLYKDMNKALAREGLFFAPDPGANASIGGMVANNAAGIRTVKYGAVRDNVLALEVVLASGELIRTGSRSVKQSAGYDLTHLFVGSEGTLGIITEATLKLAPIPEHFSAATAAFATVAAAAEVVFEIIGAALEPAALELLDLSAIRVLNSDGEFRFVEAPHLLLEFTGPSELSVADRLAQAEAICRQHGCLAFSAGIGREARARLWDVRHRNFEIHRRYYAGQSYLVGDVAVPISSYPRLAAEAAALLERLGLVGTVHGHAGDGNLHSAIFFAPSDMAARARAAEASRRIVELALSMGGTCTGEHGVGLGKQPYMALEHGPVALRLMRQIKATLDPNGILNPGKVVGPLDAGE
jgi:D-lactate dehydrogenase (cytochrome)